MRKVPIRTCRPNQDERIGTRFRRISTQFTHPRTLRHRECTFHRSGSSAQEHQTARPVSSPQTTNLPPHAHQQFPKSSCHSPLTKRLGPKLQQHKKPRQSQFPRNTSLGRITRSTPIPVARRCNAQRRPQQRPLREFPTPIPCRTV